MTRADRPGLQLWRVDLAMGSRTLVARGCVRLAKKDPPGCLSHRDDDLSLGASVVDVGQGFLGGLEREEAVDDRADDA